MFGLRKNNPSIVRPTAISNQLTLDPSLITPSIHPSKLSSSKSVQTLKYKINGRNNRKNCKSKQVTQKYRNGNTADEL